MIKVLLTILTKTLMLLWLIFQFLFLLQASSKEDAESDSEDSMIPDPDMEQSHYRMIDGETTPVSKSAYPDNY